MISSYEYRRRAREVMKKCMQVLAVVALIAALPGLINSTVILLTDADPMSIMTGPTAELSRAAQQIDTLTDQQVYEALNAFVTGVETSFDAFVQDKLWIFTVVTLLEVLSAPVLLLGQYNAMLRALRGQEISALTALSRTNDFFRALGLSLLQTLLIVLWMLPGLLVMWLGAFVPVAGLNTLLMSAGMALMIALGLRTRYRYGLAFLFMADTPFMSPIDALRSSKRVMRGRKLQLFMLDFSFLGWLMLAMLLSGMFAGALGLMIQLLSTLLVQVYMDTARTCFYEEHAVKADAPSAPQEDPLPWKK